MNIRKATEKDLSRIAEIYVFNHRMNYYPIFKCDDYAFGKMQVVTLVDHYFGKKDVLENIFVYDDGIVRGFLQMRGREIYKLYVDTFFQGGGIGDKLIEYAIANYAADELWALEKNVRAIAFYQRHGFQLSGEKEYEEGTTEYLVRLIRPTKD